MTTWKPVVSTSDFNSMKRKAGTLAAIAGARALTENPGVSNIGGSGMDFGELSKKVGVAQAAAALGGEPRPEVGLSAPAPEAEAEAEAAPEAAPDESSATMARFLQPRQQARASMIGSTTLNPLDPLTRGLSTPGLQRGGTVDYRAGGPVSGGPPGRDTVPVVDYSGGQAEAMVDNGEYVLPRKTVKQIGKSELDKLVVKTTGKKPVGYAGGGFFDRFRNRGKQIDAAVDAATTVKAPEPEPKPAPSKSMRDIMREIRKKNPPTKQPVRRYKDGGQLNPNVARLTAQEQKRAIALKKQGFTSSLQPVSGFDPSSDIARAEANLGPTMSEEERAQQALERRQNMARSPERKRGLEGLIDLGNRVTNTYTDLVARGKQPVGNRTPLLRKEPESTVTKVPEAPLGVQPPVGDSQAPGAAPLEPVQPPAAPVPPPPAAPVPQDSVIRRASPEEAGFGESVNLSRSGDVRTYSAAFSPENVARARGEAQTFEANNPLSQARTVEDINADTEALRDLRRVRTNLADGRPADYRKSEVAAPAPAKLSDMISLANLQRGFSSDQRAAGQDRFSNSIALSKEQRQRAEARNAQQDRYIENANSLLPTISESMPWLGASAESFFERASQINPTDPMQAVQALAGAQLTRAEDSSLAFKLGDQDVSWANAISILKGEEPFGWVGDKFYGAARRKAALTLQNDALDQLSKFK